MLISHRKELQTQLQNPCQTCYNSPGKKLIIDAIFIVVYLEVTSSCNSDKPDRNSSFQTFTVRWILIFWFWSFTPCKTPKPKYQQTEIVWLHFYVSGFNLPLILWKYLSYFRNALISFFLLNIITQSVSACLKLSKHVTALTFCMQVSSRRYTVCSSHLTDLCSRNYIAVESPPKTACCVVCCLKKRAQRKDILPCTLQSAFSRMLSRNHHCQSVLDPPLSADRQLRQRA
jgi:hypothetical protein